MLYTGRYTVDATNRIVASYDRANVVRSSSRMERPSNGLHVELAGIAVGLASIKRLL